ncbi:NADPH:quinone oxidoreductase [hydrothermal vent metagenome]|uniref:NADPH:quinone oxidoreductase n=1 Tax=hydrothermal vent metagenome TaxID=652676 RepID=A0A3B0V6U3_9ZZZZ
MENIRILALSGSLRKISYNTAAIQALRELAPVHVEVVVYNTLGNLPLFNPDLEGEMIPAFESLKKAVGKSDGLIIASPEYAHGISGVLKNGLDWLVSGEEFVSMPIMLLNTSPRATHAQAALREVITTMSGNIVEKACVSIPLLGSGLNCEGILNHTEISASLASGLDEFCVAIKNLELNKRM